MLASVARTFFARKENLLLCLVAAATALTYPLVLFFEVLNVGETDAAVIVYLENCASLSVPNYKKLWYARSLLWEDPVTRGDALNPFATDLFYPEALNALVHLSAMPYREASPNASSARDHYLTVSISEVVKLWSEVCPLDSDHDEYTNGQELGDPCCIWRPGEATAWSFHASHPGIYGNIQFSAPTPEARQMIESIDCAAVRKVGRYEPSDTDFFNWYYRVHLEDVEFGTKMAARIAILICHVLLVAYWFAERRLWQELLPRRLVGVPGLLTRWRTVMVLVCSYLFVDLASAFVHAYLDNCYIGSPIMGSLCKAFMHHHYHPRSLSVAPFLYWISHTLEGALPITLIYVVLGVCYELPREVELFVLFTAIFWPATYVWHNMAHLPESERWGWFRLLQHTGLALSSTGHFVHHRVIDTSWSSMAGIMDFVPNLLVRYIYDRQNANATFSILFSMLVGPWFAFFFHCVILRRGRPAHSRLLGQLPRLWSFWPENKKTKSKRR